MTTDTRGISALRLQRQLGLRRYETAWIMLHKLRRAMVNAACEALHGEVEIDDTWIGGSQAGCAEAANSKDVEQHWYWSPWKSAVKVRGGSAWL